MELQQFLRLLHGVKGPTDKGEYTCKCPAHDDKTASLCVTEKESSKYGNRRIFVCCQTKRCTTEDILRALGLTTRDLDVSPYTGSAAEKPGNTMKKQTHKQPQRKADSGTREVPDGLTVHTVEPAAQEPGKKAKAGDLGKLTAVYPYQDENGATLFEVCRFEKQGEDGKRVKTFRQRVHDPANPKAKKDGYVWSVPAGLAASTLYQLPKIKAAIAAGHSIYVVEGEKDVATLERLGYVATCNPGGAGKWKSGHSERLRDADVIVLPDNDVKRNDYTGQEHAWELCTALTGMARRVRLVDIKAACPDLPEKGDITDMVQLMGDKPALDAMTRQLNITPDFDPSGVKYWLPPMEQAAQLYSRVYGYCVDHGRICAATADGNKPLTTFVAIPRMTLERDDGATVTKEMVIDGWSANGQPLERITIKASDFNGMAWVTNRWGFAAQVMPGNGPKDKARFAIGEVGNMAAVNVTEYAHTGWRKIDGRWCYLYQGGAIGANGVTVRLPSGLERYRLDGSGAKGWEEIDPISAAVSSLSIKATISPHISIPLLATAYLAPLYSFLQAGGTPVSHSVYLCGQSGAGKSEVSALTLSHFGYFSGKTLPASFVGTANSIRSMAFTMKDMPLVVDDFHPKGTAQERNKIESIAQDLARAFGDGTVRTRLSADGTMQISRPPRCAAIISGEDLPNIQYSGLARFFVIEVEKGQVPLNEQLTNLQEQARKGYMQKAMRGYIEWLLPQVDELPDKLHERFITLRDIMISKTQGQVHGRAPEAVAHILLGYEYMLLYMQSLGIFDSASCISMMQEAIQVLTESTTKQAASMVDEKPSRIFLDNLTELLASKTVGVQDISSTETPRAAQAKDMIGYADNDYYYFMPQKALAAVTKLCREQGLEYPVSLKALYKALRADGVLENSGKEETTRVKWVDGRAIRLLWIPRHLLDGRKAGQEQTRMELTPVDSTEAEAVFGES